MTTTNLTTKNSRLELLILQLCGENDDLREELLIKHQLLEKERREREEQNRIINNILGQKQQVTVCG